MIRPAKAAVGSTTRFFDGRIQEAGCVLWSNATTVKAGRDLPAGEGDSPEYGIFLPVLPAY